MIAIVGSRTLWPSVDVVSAVIAVMAAADPYESFGVRTTVGGAVNTGVELAVVKLCDKLSRTIRTFGPISGQGRASVFERDFRLVEAATKVIAFFPSDNPMSGGTGHVVKAALDRGVEVEAYGMNLLGEITLLGSELSDPDVLQRMYRGV